MRVLAGETADIGPEDAEMGGEIIGDGIGEAAAEDEDRMPGIGEQADGGAELLARQIGGGRLDIGNGRGGEPAE